MTRDLRDYQVAAIDAAVEVFAEHDAAQLHMACGSGKTLTALRIAERVAPGPALVVVAAPTVALIDQVLREWRTAAEQPFSALAVCSDDTAVDAPVHLDDLTAGATTDPVEVADWLEQTPGRRVIATTYLSAPVVAAAAVKLDMTAGLLVCDEAHHLTGRLDLATHRILDRDFFPARRRLHQTATPRVDLRNHGRVGAIGMDDEELFGPVAYRYRFGRAIDDGWLCDYRLAVIGVSTSEAHALLSDQGVHYVAEVGEASLPILATQAALLRAHQLYGVQRAITFHPRILDAQVFTRSLGRTVAQLDPEAARRLTARHVSSNMSPEQRRTALHALRHTPAGTWTTLSNARCLSEGVDIPAVDCVVFAHPKRSTVDIVQAVGRALRRSRDEGEVATVLIPIVIDDQDGEVGDLDPGDYRIVWEVVGALRAHDEDLGIALDTQRAYLDADDPQQLPDKITVTLPPGTAEHVLTSLTLMLVEQTTSSWWEWLGAARAYQAEHGDLLIPADYIDPRGRRLGNWLTLQRSRARDAPERRTALDELGMVWDTFDARWETMLTAARAYRTTHGHLRASKVRGEQEKQLALWIQWQRRQHRQGLLRADRAARLEQLGVLDSGFSAGLAACDRHLAQHGDLDIAHSYLDEDGFRLGWWLARQRTRASLPDHAPRRAGHRSPLTPEERAALEQRGVRWKARRGSRGLTTAEAADLAADGGSGEHLVRLAEAGVHHRALAEALGITTAAVASRLVRARRHGGS